MPQTNGSTPTLAVVVPCYNEEASLPETHRTLSGLLDRLTADGLIAGSSHILYVDDGSTDSTWKLIAGFAAGSGNAAGLRLAANTGHQHALMAGLEETAPFCDAAVTIDADLQDDPEAIRDMIMRYREGDDVVYGVRRHREDTPFKLLTAKGFYRLRDALGVKTVYNHADFRLLSSRAVGELLRYDEANLFIRGIVPMLGFSQSKVFYDRTPRRHGESKYPVGKMLNFAADGITSFSARPARMILGCGLIFTLIALAILTYVLIRYFSGHTIAGWTSIILSIWFCTGIILLALGVVGEYLAKVYMEVKRRPRWHIMERTGATGK